MADLRTWLDEVNQLGQLMNVNDAHWNLELSTLTELINERSKTRPAIVFDKIKEYPAGHRVAVNLLSSLQRLALTMGMDPNLAPFDFVQQWRKRVKSIQPIEPRLVKSAPLFENVQKGADIDLFKFPVPKWHELDGGRYIGTDDLVVTRDPEENGSTSAPIAS